MILTVCSPLGLEPVNTHEKTAMTKKAEQFPQQPQQPPRRPPDIVLPIGQPIPKGPGIEWWIKRIREDK
jgi:hypothetical protein